MRSKLQKEMLMKENEKKEQELLALAQKARFERIGLKPADASLSHSENSAMDSADKRGNCERVREKDKNFPNETMEEKEERLQRERIREDRRRERERDRRLEAKDAAMGKKRKITRDRDRDISEKVALGIASIGAGKGGEVMYDQRLFNQGKGIYSGFATDDQYYVYDKGLFTAQPTLSTLYKPKKDVDADMYGGADEQLDKILNTNRFKPDKGFAGAFEKAEESDPFGLDQFLTQVKEGKKVLEKAGTGGTMAASAGASMQDGYDGGSGRTRVGFERGQ